MEHAPHNRLMTLSWTMNKELINYMLREFKKANLEDIHPIHAYTLGVIYAHPQITMKQLVAFTSRTKSDVSLTIKKLIDNGYLTKVRSESDRRNFYMELTHKAIRVKDLVYEITARLDSAVNTTISEHDVRITQHVMEQYLNILKNLE